MTIIETRGLGYSYGRQVALRAIDLTVRRGEMVGICGRNGAGKSTLTRILAGMLRDCVGDVQLLGRPLRSWSGVELARRVACVAQQPEIPFPYRSGEVVLMGRLPHQRPGHFVDRKEDVLIARESLESVGAATFAERPFAELSGGERQLVVLASALAQRPELIVLDEPTAFLDLNHRLRFTRLLQALRDEHGLTILLVTHDIELAAAFCDRLLLLKDGRLAFDLRSGERGRVPLTSDVIARAFDLPVGESGVRLVYA
jgi:iron complex transport system ATP-binding protein